MNMAVGQTTWPFAKPHGRSPNHMAVRQNTWPMPKNIANGLNVWPTAFFNIARGNAPGTDRPSNRLANGHIQRPYDRRGLNVAVGQKPT